MLPLAGEIALAQGGQDADGGMQAGAGVARADGGGYGRQVGVAVGGGRAAGGLGGEFKAAVFAPRAILAKALDAGVYEARVEFAQPVVADAKPLHYAFGEVFKHDIRP